MFCTSGASWFDVMYSTVLRPRNAMIAIGTLVRQHEGKAHVVAGGRGGAAAPARELRRLGQRAQRLWLSGVRVDWKRLGITPGFVRRNDEMGIHHAERLPDLLLEILAERLLGKRFHDQPKHIEAEAVVPDRA